jgi:hypothetical protein
LIRPADLIAAPSAPTSSFPPEAAREFDCPMKFGAPLLRPLFDAIERRLQLDCRKWDTQVSDRQILLPQPLLINPALTPGPVSHFPVVDMSKIVAGLYRGAGIVKELHLQVDAPPAFMIDSLRHGAGVPIHAGMVDNRSAVDPSDFPSGSLLAQSGIARVILIQEDRKSEDDLNSVLLGWQSIGIEISFLGSRSNAVPERITIEPPSWWRRLWYRFVTAFYSKDGFGAFGRVVSSGG